MRRRSTRKQKGRGCGCGGMEMLGFPKTGGFMSLFGGQEEPMGTPPGTIGQDSSVMMKNSEQMMKEALPEEIVSNSAPRRSRRSPSQRPQVDGEPPRRPQRDRDMMKNSEVMMKEASPEEIVSNSAPRRGKSGYQRPQVDGEAPRRPQRDRGIMRSSGSSIQAEIKMIKNDIQRLQSDVSELQSSSGNSSRGLFGGRRKTLRRIRKHRR